MNLGIRFPDIRKDISWGFFLCVVFHPRDQHLQVLQSLPAFPCSAAPQLVTTGSFRFCSNPISPRVWMGFSKPCPATWCWVCCAGCLLLSGCWWGQHRPWQNALGLPVVCVCAPAVHQPRSQLWHPLSCGNSSSEESLFCTF